MTDLILASQSPRRKQLLEGLGLKLKCLPVDIDESVQAHEKPQAYCERLALEKAQAAFKLCDDKLNDLPILGSDTIVVFEGEILGKPKDSQQAFEVLKKLSGNRHQVMTAVSVVSAQQNITKTSISWVEFGDITDEQIQNYIKTGEPMDKAGSYGIQGLASIWVKQITGSHSGIMGLPLYETCRILEKFNITVL